MVGPSREVFLRVMHSEPFGEVLRVIYGTDGRQYFLLNLKYIYLENSRGWANAPLLPVGAQKKISKDFKDLFLPRKHIIYTMDIHGHMYVPITYTHIQLYTHTHTHIHTHTHTCIYIYMLYTCFHGKK